MKNLFLSKSIQTTPSLPSTLHPKVPDYSSPPAPELPAHKKS